MLISELLRPKIDSAYLKKELAEILMIENFNFQYPFILSSKSDTTAKHFLNYCIENKLNVNYCSIETIIETPDSLHDFLNILEKVTSIYLRPPILSNEQDIILWSILHSTLLNGKHINVIQPSLAFLNYSKPLQILKSIYQNQNVIVKPIDSFIKNISLTNKNELFIIKGISDLRTIVVYLNDKRLDWSTKNGLTHPYLMQKTILGNNYRVHVIDDKVFAVKISYSTEIDYRYSTEKLSFMPFDLPKLVKEFCIKVTKSEQLVFSGIDFIVENDTWYCLEINPNPGFHPYDINSKMSISKALYNSLIKKTAYNKKFVS